MKQLLLLQFCLLFAIAANADSEPNNDAQSATVLANGSAVSGALTAGSDNEDWYAVLVPGNSELVLDLAMASLLRGSGDSQLRLRREGSDNVLSEYKVEPSVPLHVAIPITEPGRYLVELALGANSTASPQYQLSATVSSLAQPAIGGLYDGLWNISDQGYVTIHQKGQQIAMVILGNSDALGFRWEAQFGEIEGNRALTGTVIGYVDLLLDVEFTSLRTATVTINDCATIVRGNPCMYADGTTFFLEKLDEWPGERPGQ